MRRSKAYAMHRRAFRQTAVLAALSACAALAGCQEPVTGGLTAGDTSADANLLDDAAARQADAAPATPAEAMIPAGPFWLGCSPLDTSAVCTTKGSPEKPQHEVVLSAYAIDLFETTVAEYGACVQAGACSAPAAAGASAEPFNFGVAGREQHPVNGVSWHQAFTYCQWRGKRLPTEAEWEKAARGGCELHKGECAATALVYPWGNQPADCTRANFAPAKTKGCQMGITAPVGSLPAGRSPYGLWDAAGNVWEWTADWFDAGAYSTSAQRDPQGPTTGQGRTRRGGGYPNEAETMRVARRYGLTAEVQSSDTGIRCARSL
jgi:formylglycine-generating enzyme required for sulfatase activity